MSTLFVNAQVYSPSAPFSSAVLVQDGKITWIGDSSGAEVHRDLASTIVNCDGQFLAPAFVDAHVHSTSTGVLLEGLDLSMVNNATELLELLSRYSRIRKGDTIIGHGWDESAWSNNQLPSRTEIDRATWGSVVYLSRVDVHSALVSSALLAQVPEVTSLSGYSESAISREAHGAARTHVLGHLSSGTRNRAQETFANHSLSRGIASVHEMAGPVISSQSDASSLLTLSGQGFGPKIFLYWGQLAQDGGIEVADQLRAHGLGGDLFVDGAIGSRTACLSESYADDPGNYGVAYLNSDMIAEHISRCHESNYHTGFHVIGDFAMQCVLEGFEKASAIGGSDRLRRARHRLEHAELITDDQMQMIKEYNLTASMQPLFDALWGGLDGMYSQRLGERSSHMNRWGSLAGEGCLVCFSSDTPVTSMSPWHWIKAAMFHSQESQRMTARAAFSAATRAGWRALGPQFDGLGVIVEGAPADLALWRVDEYAVQVPDSRVVQWSTDPRSATVALPVLSQDDHERVPECLLTMVDGQIRYQESNFDGIDK